MPEPIEIKIEAAELQRSLKKLISKTENLKPLMKNITGIMMNSVEENFEKEGHPDKWTPLAKATIKQRTKKACRSIEEFQAVSQNFGHQHMGTTFSSYGKLPAYQVKNVISGLNFSGKNKGINKEKLQKPLEEMIED